MDAVEIIKETDEEIVQDWQKTEVERRIEKYRNNPELLIDEEEIFRMLDKD